MQVSVHGAKERSWAHSLRKAARFYAKELMHPNLVRHLHLRIKFNKPSKEFPDKGVVMSRKVKYSSCKPFVLQSRVTNPPWMYRDLEQVDWWPLILNPQENVCMDFQNNLDTRLLEKDYHVTQRPCTLFR